MKLYKSKNSCNKFRFVLKAYDKKHILLTETKQFDDLSAAIIKQGGLQ